MRRSYISPEFISITVPGTYNMWEESNFFASKMLEVEDFININKSDLIYYQKTNGEQLELAVENSLDSIIFSLSDNKKINHKLSLDKSQPTSQLNNNTRWILEINSLQILKDFLFANLKRWRTFEGLKNTMTLEGDVNVAISKYILNNVIDRYKFSEIELFVDYKDLRNKNGLKWKNDWNPLLSEDKLVKKFNTEANSDSSIIKIFFNAENRGDTYNFDYYFNISYEKI